MDRIIGSIIKVECYKDAEFVNWFATHRAEFGAAIAQKLDFFYVINASHLKKELGNIVIYNDGAFYVGFVRYRISGSIIELSYIAVESIKQRNGIGLRLASIAIDAGLECNCTHVAAMVSDSAKRLFERLREKYRKLGFTISCTGYKE